jgi:uncharacterized spore protein YtfJ
MANESATDTLQAPRHRTDELLVRLAERVGARFDASNVFGAPVERDGVTVIPVATIRFGLAGGAGSDPRRGQDGEGGGAAGSASAAGYRRLFLVHSGGTALAALDRTPRRSCIRQKHRRRADCSYP